MLQTLRSSLRAAFSVSARRGFTLIEIAIVLVVIGLIVSGGLLAISPVLQSAKLNETRQKIATVEAALLGYVITNGCLPCPAATGAGATGVTNNGSADYTPPCGSGGACAGSGRGLVPWVTLGISENEATDGWYRRLTYAVDPALTDASSDVQRTATGSFPSFTSGITMQNLSAASLGYTAIAYVLLSHGPDGSFGESSGGGIGAVTSASNAETENGDADLIFATGSPTTDFDDMVNFKSYQPLILSCGSGSCGNPS